MLLVVVPPVAVEPTTVVAPPSENGISGDVPPAAVPRSELPPVDEDPPAPEVAAMVAPPVPVAVVARWVAPASASVAPKAVAPPSPKAAVGIVTSGNEGEPPGSSGDVPE